MRNLIVNLTPPGIAAILYPLAWLAQSLGFARDAASRAAPAGAVLFAVGCGLFIWAGLQFWRFRTTIVPAGQPSAIIDQGPYRFSRNPIYVADLALTSGVALILGNPVYFAIPLLLFAAFHFAFIPAEEAKMRAHFRARYDDYCRQVRRWL